MPTFYYRDIHAMQNFQNYYMVDAEAIIMKVLMKYGPIVVLVAQGYSPVRTGALKNSITFSVDANELMLNIYGTVYYFKFVEFGTKFMSARRMCAMAYEQYEHQILQEIDDEIRLAAEAYNTGVV
jgi:hypothetical protein